MMNDEAKRVIRLQFLDLLFNVLSEESLATAIYNVLSEESLATAIYNAATYAGWCRGYAEGCGHMAGMRQGALIPDADVEKASIRRVKAVIRELSEWEGYSEEFDPERWVEKLNEALDLTEDARERQVKGVGGRVVAAGSIGCKCRTYAGDNRECPLHGGVDDHGPR